MRLMLTRAKADASETLERLQADHTVLHEPLLTILPGPDADAVSAIVLDGVQGLLATSSNGVRAMASWPEATKLPLFAVGDATARMARELGFSRIESADGDVGALAALVKAKCKPADGPLVHGAGTVRAGDLKGVLEADGFQVRRLALYRADTATTLSTAGQAFLKADKPGGVLFYSPRTAETFAQIAQKAGLKGKLGQVTAFCLSPAVAKALDGMGLGDVKIADKPREDALLALLDKTAQTLATKQAGTTKPEAPKMAQPPKSQSTKPGSAAPKLGAKPAGSKAGGAAKPAAKPQKASGGRMGWYVAGVLALLIAGGAGTIAGLPYVPENIKDRLGLAAAQSQPQLQQQQNLPDYGPQLRVLSQKISALEQAPAPTIAGDNGGDPAAIAALSDRIAALEAQDSTAMRDDTEVKILKNRIQALESLVNDLVNAPSVALVSEDFTTRMEEIALAASSGRSAAILSLSALDRAVRSGSPFGAELTAAQGLITDDMSAVPFTQLTDFADEGVMTRRRLEDQFALLAREAVRAAMVPEDAPWYRRWFANALSIVTIRPVGDVPGGDVPARIARAESALDHDDLAGAVREVSALGGVAGRVMADWLTAAGDRLMAEQALISLQSISLAPPPTPGPTEGEG